MNHSSDSSLSDQTRLLRQARLPTFAAFVLAAALVARVPFTQSRELAAGTERPKVTPRYSAGGASSLMETNRSANRPKQTGFLLMPAEARVLEPKVANISNRSSNIMHTGEANVEREIARSSRHTRQEPIGKRGDTAKDNDVTQHGTSSRPENDTAMGVVNRLEEIGEWLLQSVKQPKSSTGNTLRLGNLTASGEVVYFTIDGQSYSLSPGHWLTLRENDSWVLQIRGRVDQRRRVLQSGDYVFRMSNRKWELGGFIESDSRGIGTTHETPE